MIILYFLIFVKMNKILKKILILGFDNLISLGKKRKHYIIRCYNVNVVNYLEVIENKNSLPDSFWDDALNLINKWFKLSDRNSSLISKTQK